MAYNLILIYNANVDMAIQKNKNKKASAVTHSEGSHARLAGLGGLAGGSGSWGTLVLGIGALAGGGLGGLRHGEGLREGPGVRWRETRG